MRPRAFSSGKRSGSVPVSASTSVDLPWSTWPAVATTLTSASRRHDRDHAQRARRVARRRTGRPTRRSHTTAPSRPSATTRDRAQDVAARRRRRRPRPRRRPTGSCGPGTEPPPAAASVSTTRRAGKRSRRSRRRASAARRPASWPCARAGSRRRRRRGTRARRPRAPASVTLSGRSARASGCRASSATRSARPTMIPACGPPSSLSPEKVTSAAPASRHWRTPGSSPSHAGRSASHGVRSSSSPDPASTTTGGPSVASSATERRLGEADHAVVRRVHLQHDRGSLRDRALVVGARACGWSCPPRPACAPVSARISGTRNPPPISTSSPRDTSTSRSRASVASTSSTAAALLLTTKPGLRAARERERARRRDPGASRAFRCRAGTRRSCSPPASVIAARAAASERRAPEVRVEQHAGRVHNRSEQRRTPAVDASPRVGDDGVEVDRVGPSSAPIRLRSAFEPQPGLGDRLARAFGDERVGQLASRRGP